MNEKEFNNLPEKERKNRVLEGYSYWASVHKPNMSAVKKFNGDPTYVVNLALDEENKALAESFGLKIFPADDFIPMPFVKLQRKIRAPRTVDDVKIQVVDSMQKPIPENILIGNGSLVRCKFGTRWTIAGVYADLYKVQVRQLVEFEQTEDKAFVMDEEGFTVNETKTTSTDDGEINFDD